MIGWWELVQNQQNLECKFRNPWCSIYFNQICVWYFVTRCQRKWEQKAIRPTLRSSWIDSSFVFVTEFLLISIQITYGKLINNNVNEKSTERKKKIKSQIYIHNLTNSCGILHFPLLSINCVLVLTKNKTHYYIS